jgi:putative ABC transport system ATP-binding protein
LGAYSVTHAQGALVAVQDASFERAPLDTGRDEGFRLVVPNFVVGAGARLALTGQSGAGKTTLLNLLSLARRPTTAASFTFRTDAGLVDIGTAWAKGQGRALDAIRRRKLGVARHSGEAVAFLSVRETLALRRRVARLAPESARLDMLLEKLDLVGLKGRKPDMLSQGQRQRLGIACALVHGPDLVIADEPTASLDDHNADQVMALLADSVKNGKSAVVIATHDPERARRHGFIVISAQTRRVGAGSNALKETIFASGTMPA